MFEPNVGHYEVHDLIRMCCDGNASVHAARHIPSGKLVAVKVFNIDNVNDDNYQKIRHEITITRQFRHQNVILYHSNFVVSTELWVVMPFMTFGSCRDIISTHFTDGLPELAIAYILKDVLNALDYIHKKGYVHRAVKASHILVSGNGQACLSGLREACSIINNGRWQKSLHNFPCDNSKNLSWLSPELMQQDTEGYNEKSDIYSVGVTACELANGVIPFADLPVTLMLTEKLRGNSPYLLDCSTVPSTEELEETHSSISGVGDSLTRYQVRRGRIFSQAFHQLTEACLKREARTRPSAHQLPGFAFFNQCKRTGGLLHLLKPTFPFTQTEHYMEPSKKKDSLIRFVTNLLGKTSSASDKWDFFHES